MNEMLEENLAAAMFSRKAAECKTKEEMIAFCDNFLLKNKPPSEEDVKKEMNKFERFGVGDIPFIRQDRVGRGVWLSATHQVDEYHLHSYPTEERYRFEDDMKKELLQMLAREAYHKELATFQTVRVPSMMAVRYIAEMSVIPPEKRVT
jgi:hypothetical protein